MVPATARVIERASQVRLGGRAAAAFDLKLGGGILAHPLPLDFGVHRCIVDHCGCAGLLGDSQLLAGVLQSRVGADVAQPIAVSADGSRRARRSG
ncbi:hypothetical protein ABZ914_48840 [Spirillospora sp. NPDC046719]